MNKKYIKILACIFLAFFTFNIFVLADTATVGNVNCDSWGKARDDLQNVFNLIKIIVPFLVIGLSSFDFIKAITAKDDKDMKKAFQTLMKRLVLAVVLYFLPVLLNLLLDIFETNSSVCLE